MTYLKGDSWFRSEKLKTPIAILNEQDYCYLSSSVVGIGTAPALVLAHSKKKPFFQISIPLKSMAMERKLFNLLKPSAYVGIIIIG